MAVRKALVIEGVYLHTEDAPEVDDIQVYVSDETVDITTHHKNTISLDFEELDAINALVAEARKPKRLTEIKLNFGSEVQGGLAAAGTQFADSIRAGLETAVRESERRAARNPAPQRWLPDWSKIPENIKFIAKDSDGEVWGFVKRPRMFRRTEHGFWWDSPAATTRLLDVTIPGDWKESLHERPVVVETPVTWPPDWSTIPVGFDHAAVDDDGRVWAYPQTPKTLRTMWATYFLGNAHSIGYVTLPAGMTWQESYCQRQIAKDDLAFLNLSWADVPSEYIYVAADKDGKVWAYQKAPYRYTCCWGAHGPSNKRLCSRTPGSFSDWKESLRIRPTAMKQVLGIDWADVPEGYNFVAADEDGKVYGYRPRPYVTGAGVWLDRGSAIGFRKLTQITPLPNPSWRNTLFVRPGYTEPQS